MGSKIDTQSDEAEKAVRDIRRATRRHFSAEDKVRIVIAGLRGEDSVAELCRKEGINQNLYYRWSKDFLEAGKKRLAGDTAREATSDEVKGLPADSHQLKELLGADAGEPPAQKSGAGRWGVRYMMSITNRSRNCHRWHNEHVDCSDAESFVAQEAAPGR
jgi:transposase